MKKALLLLVLLGAGALLARYHVANQYYYPVTQLASSDGYTFHLVQDRVDTRSACGEANDRFLAPVKARCPNCRVVYARCERELQGLELKLLMGEPVPVHVVVARGLRLAVDGQPESVRRDCEEMAVAIVRAGAGSAACAHPGVMRRP
jgi:hypothetical protein